MTGSDSGVIALYSSRSDDFWTTSEGITLTAIAETIARLKGSTFICRWDEPHRSFSRVFFIPDDTLVTSEARWLGIGSADDLFGGVVPHAFVTTKAITHGLVSAAAERPAGGRSIPGARRATH